MKKTTRVFLLLFLVSTFLTAQNQTQKWYFGYNAGLDFSGNGPLALSSDSMNTYEGSASISDADGNLLFYTDGITVWNKTNAIMANGTGLLGDPSSTQSAIIVKKPGSAYVYYVFTVAAGGGNAGLRYSTINTSYLSGFGSVTFKNIALYTPTCEKITAVRHCNGRDIWIVSHDYNSNIFRAYLLTMAGLSITPVLSSAGNNITGNSLYTIGQMKISPDGHKLGLVINDHVTPQTAALYDFDPSTGLVSNPLILAYALQLYGCEFSSDGSKFYVSRFTGSQILQWDLSSGSNTSILASCYTITADPSVILGSLQLATDGKIYVAHDYRQNLGVINSPNASGAGCNYIDVGLQINPGRSSLGLPNFMTSDLISFTYTHTNCLSTSFSAYTNSFVTGVIWSFGDINSGSANTSTTTNPTHLFSSSGNYTVKLILHTACGGNTIQQTVAVGCTGFQAQNIAEQSINIYPNPGNGFYTVEGIKNRKISLYNHLGVLISEQVAKEDEITIDISNLSRGVYYLKCINNQTTQIKKLVKTD